MNSNNNPDYIEPYERIHIFTMTLGKEMIKVATKPGLPELEDFSPCAQLMIENARIGSADTVIVYGSHQGALSVYIARNLPNANILITDHDALMLNVTEQTLLENQITSVNILKDIDLVRARYQDFNTVIIQIPKGRQLNRRWLLQSYNALVSGGSLYLVGANNSGIQSVIRDSGDLFGPGRILAYKKGNRIARFIKNSIHMEKPAWTSIPGIAPDTWIEFSITLTDHTFRIRSLPGVFSSGRLDAGTEMLLKSIVIPPGGKILDLGCGYGIIGLFAAVQGAGFVHLVDNNLLAVAASRETLAVNNITNAEVFAGDLLSPIGSNQYDLILSNPPFHTGQAVDFDIAEAMISQSHRALKPGGQMVIVANRFIRYNRLIEQIFGNISVLTESGKFHVLSGLKSS